MPCIIRRIQYAAYAAYHIIYINVTMQHKTRPYMTMHAGTCGYVHACVRRRAQRLTCVLRMIDLDDTLHGLIHAGEARLLILVLLEVAVEHALEVADDLVRSLWGEIAKSEGEPVLSRESRTRRTEGYVAGLRGDAAHGSTPDANPPQ